MVPTNPSSILPSEENTMFAANSFAHDLATHDKLNGFPHGSGSNKLE
jgi:hypothetical protein